MREAGDSSRKDADLFRGTEITRLRAASLEKDSARAGIAAQRVISARAAPVA